MRHRPEIDGLRGIAVIAVVLFHARVTAVPGGYLGVDIFFVISGYLITTILVEEVATGRMSLARFYERRVRRIAPALGLVAFASLVPAWWLMPTQQMQDFGRSLVSVAVFAANLNFWRSSGYFDLSAEERPLLHTWSLGVEEQFYLLYPLLLLWAWRRGMGWTRAAVILGLAASFALTLAVWRTHAAANFYLLPTRAWELLAGATVALLPPRAVERLAPWARECLSLAALALVLSAVLTVDPRNAVSPWSQALPVVACALLIAVVPVNGPAATILGLRPLVGVGLISYSVYLWHHPILDFMRMSQLGALSSTQVALSIATTFVLSAATWRWVEQPVRRALFGTRRVVLLYVGLGSLLLAATGLLLAAPGPLQRWRVGDSVHAEEAAVQALVESRVLALRSGICHFNGRGPNVAFDDFLAAWDCWGSPAPRRLVVGDSHAADVAVALRSVGLDVGQMTGAGCSLVPALMSGPCRRQFDHVRAQARAQGIQMLVLANQYAPTELTEESLDAMAVYWALPGVELWLVTHLPEFPNLTLLRPRALMLGQVLNSETLHADETVSATSEEGAARLAENWPQLHVLNARQLFCGIDPAVGCTWRAKGQDLLVDGHHFTVTGAAEFGRQLVAAGLYAALNRANGP
jgi:peptidoglycan/LPS O-acetylase OafA/YrhL